MRILISINKDVPGRFVSTRTAAAAELILLRIVNNDTCVYGLVTFEYNCKLFKPLHSRVTPGVGISLT